MKKFLSAILCIAMVLGIMNFTAFADAANNVFVSGELGTIWGSASGIDPQESLVTKLYAEETLIAQKTLNNIDGIITELGELGELTHTYYIDQHDAEDPYWEDEWFVDFLTAEIVPTHEEIWVDGELAVTGEVQINMPDNLDPVLWGDVKDVKVAKIGDAYYNSLQEAIDAAAEGQTITLLGDMSGTGITVAAGKDVVIDLGDKTVVGDFMVYGKATIKNGEIVNNALVSGIESNGASADLTVEDLTVTSNRHALRIDGGKATINSGVYTSTANGISCYAINAGGDIATEVVINNGTFIPSENASTQGTSVMLKNALVTSTINGGTFNTEDVHCFENYGTSTITGGTFNGTLVTNATTEISGGTFKSWSYDARLKDGYHAFENEGMYTVKKAWTLTLIANNGITSPEPMFVADNEALTIPANTFTKENCSFAGWNTQADGTGTAYADEAEITPTEDITLYAQWNKAIVFNKNAEDAEGTMADQIVSENDTETQLSENAFTRAHYTFAGWNTQADGSGDNIDTSATVDTIPAGTTLYAQWEKVSYTLTFENTGDTEIAPITTPHGEAISIPEPTKTGYTFAGWTLNGEAVDTMPAAMPTENQTYAATWTANSYSIVFNKNNESATGSMDNLTATYDTPIALTENAFSLADNYFIGWATESGATTAAYANQTEILNLSAANGAEIDLYAVWNNKPAQTPATEMTAQTFTYDGEAKSFVMDAADEGYTITYKQGGEEVTPTNAGSYDVVITKGETPENAAYNNTIHSGLIIDKASVAKPSADETEFTYNGEAQTYTIEESELYTISGNTATNAGETTVTVSLIDSANYMWIDTTTADLTFTFTIAKAPLTVTADDKSIYVGTTLPEYTYKITGTLFGEDTFTDISISCPTANNSAEGNYAITVSGGTLTNSGNYDVTYESGTLTVRRRSGGRPSASKPTPTPTPEVTPTPTPEENAPVNNFTDIAADSWYYNGVKFVTENKLMVGISDNEFAPMMKLTRAMLITILHRNAGSPEAPKSNFTDVQEGSYYESAAGWASANGIISGVSATELAPDRNISREQLAVILFRYAGNTGTDAVTTEENLTSFVDTDEISEFAISALNWAVGQGLISGKDGNRLDPLGEASRAEVATILARFLANNN